MPYAKPSEANNKAADTIQAIDSRKGTGDWREVLTASTRHRSVLIRWNPGSTHPMHRHPEGEEIFVIHEGEAEFDFGSGRTERAGPGSVLYAAAGQPHTLRVVGVGPLLMMCFLSANTPDDTVDC